MAVTEESRPKGGGGLAWLYDARIRAVVYQVVTVAIFVAFIFWLTSNTMENLAVRGIATGFTFLGHRSNIELAFSLIEFSSDSSYLIAFYVGIINTLFVSAIAIVLATIIGFTTGVMRLSSNWMVARIAQVYLESVRNVPLLLQILFWYGGVLQTLPTIRNSLKPFENVHINNRGIFMPEPVFASEAALALYALIFAVVLAIVISIWARRRQERTGKQFHSFFFGLGLIVLLPLIVFLAAGSPVEFDVPKATRFGLTGGWTIIPEFLALLIALTLYHAAFIGEIVRAGIQAVSHGQTEAARSLGLKPSITLRLVIVPQAMRVIVPPLTSMFLNITKNSSLAAAVGYPELVAVWAGTVLNQTGQALECMAMTMGVYFVISLVISAFMNWYNKRMMLVER